MCFDVQEFAVLVEEDLVSGYHLCLGINLMGDHEIHVLLVKVMSNSIGCCLEVGKSSLLCFFDPGSIVAVTIEDDPLMVLDLRLDKIVDSTGEIFCAFELVCKLLEALCNCRVENCVCKCDGCGRTQHPELELVARECERRCPVTVSRISRELRQNMHADLKKFLLLSAIRCIVLDGFKDLCELGT